MSSPILVNFGLGGFPRSVYAHQTWEKKKSWDSDLYKSHLGKNLTARFGGAVRIGRGSVGQSELVAAASHKAV